MAIDWLFFDLDGTLTDSESGMAESFTYIFDKYGIEYTSESLRKLYGPPLTISLSDYFDQDKINVIVDEFREHYSNERMLGKNKMYDGVYDLLEALKSAGYNLGIVTGKPQYAATAVAEHFGLVKYFDAIYGAARRGTDKIITLNHALKVHSCDRERAIMIGDRLYDLEAATLADIKGGIGVLWGYGDREELEAHNPLFIAEEPWDIATYLGVAQA